MLSHLRPVSLAIALASAAAPSIGQCPTVWTPASPQPQLSGVSTCSLVWDPDGAGPLTARLVVGGEGLGGGFAGPNDNVLTWDGSEWQAVGGGPGTGTTRRVHALTVWNGLLVAGGEFTGSGADHIAYWTGSNWVGFGGGLPDTVRLLTPYTNQMIAVCQVGGVYTFRRWNGSNWSLLPSPPQLSAPAAMIVYQGMLCVAGRYSTLGGVLERWNGTTWLPSILASASVDCLAVVPSLLVGGADTLYAAGRFGVIGGTTASRIAATSGGTAFAWSQVGGGLPDRCFALHARRSGLVGTAVVAAIQPTSAVAQVLQLSNGAFVAMGYANPSSLTYYNGSVHCTVSVSNNDSCKRYDGTQWATVVGPGLDGEVRAMAPSGGDMIVGGTFTTHSGTTIDRIARWDGATFQPLGPGLTGTSVDALLPAANGDVIAGGLFLQAGATPLNHIGRWDGTAWSALGTGMDQQVLALCRLPNGDVVAGGKFTTAGGVVCSHVARWDGTSWSTMGVGFNGDVQALVVSSDGTLIAGGSFTNTGGVPCNRIARWNGNSWLQIGAGTNGDVYALAARPNGDVIVGGAFTTAGGLSVSHCARWTGVQWTTMNAASMDTNPVRALFVMPDGDVLAGRGFGTPTAAPDDGIARWDGSTWGRVRTGLAGMGNVSAMVRAMALRADGALVVGGAFTLADGATVKNLAVLASDCPATSTPYGAGCQSAAGPLVLSPVTLPWIGSSFLTTTSGVAANSLCLGLIGFAATAIPLDTLLPEGQPGCLLLTPPDITMLLTPGPGSAQSSFALADDPALVGAVFHQQTIPLEFDPTGAIAAIRGSNALSLSIGSF